MAAPKWLSNIGHVLKVVFLNPQTIKVEAGIASIILPGFAGLINSAASAIINAETTAAAAGMQNGTGLQKMAYAVMLFQTTYNQWAVQNGLSQEPAAVQAFLQQVFNLIETLQLPSTTAATTQPVQTAQTVAAVQV